MYIFLDTEFTDFSDPHLISIAMISEDGAHQIYREISDYPKWKASQFVNDIVVPMLDIKSYGTTYVWAGLDVVDWFNSLPSSDITIVLDYAGDWHLLQQLIEKHMLKLTKQITPLMSKQAFENMMNSKGFTRPTLVSAAYDFAAASEIKFQEDINKRHHALVDVKAMRYGWQCGYQYGKDSTSS
jgi:hypothetical protein